jgi:indole-3-glycerol phosphate synthase/phosphoribosylanthranilate isomerase
VAEGLLGTIAAAKRDELDERFRGVSLDTLREVARPTSKSLAAVLRQRGARFILEVKKASPSQGMIRATADVAAIARGYAGVADGLSVLTDAGFFGGSIDDLTAAATAFDGPILAKDFFLDRRQVVEARIAGADAVLVMLSLLDDAAARTIIAEASSLGMDALVEVHDESEMRRALALEAPLIGINNRDLRDLTIDLATTERLAPMAPDRVIVSESGIGSRADVQRLAHRADGFLIGTALMRADDPAQAARSLLFGRVKLCGLTNAADVAAGAAATHMGFVFVPGSPRHLSAADAAPLAGAARRAGILPVGVFRDAPLAEVAESATLLNLHAIQLHGSEDAAYVAALRRELPLTSEIWTALSVGIDDLTRDRGGDRIVFDNGDGGSGRPFDWEAVRGHPALAEAVIAGGIGPANACEARALAAFAIDVGSALDDTPGVKSAAKIRSLFDALRPRAREEARTCA